MEQGNQISLKISTVNNVDYNIKVSDSITGYQLKEYIYNNLTKSLQILMMKIFYAGVQINNDRKLDSYKFNQGKDAKIMQTKMDLDQIPGLIVSYQQDQISLEDKTARMTCGHVIGRDCMTQLIRSLVQSNKYNIICPSFKPNGQRCSMQWQYAMCKKIGVFTVQQIIQFQTGLSKNWISQNTLQCPGCKQNLYKGELNTKRVKCPRCKYGDFCSSCLRKWKKSGHDICGNQGCSLIQQYLQKSPWDASFNLRDKNNLTIKIKAPKHRACPKCFAIIEHDGGCKHMCCKNCSQSFCWVCLDLKENGTWKCGSFNTYCGKVQQVQKSKQS